MGEPDLRVDVVGRYLDEPPLITVAGATPSSPVEVEVVQVDGTGRRWSSTATFVADDAGTVDTSCDAPSSGPYQGVDPSGPVWSATSEGTEPFAVVGEAPVPLEVAATSNSQTARTAATRLLLAPGTSVTTLDTAGLVSRLYQPARRVVDHGMVYFGGSDGKPRHHIAALLSRHDMPTASCAYFAAPGLSATCVEIPLEPIIDALAMIARTLDVETLYVGGLSKGGELALALAAYVPDVVAGAISWSGSPAAWTGIGSLDASSWTRHGVAHPHLSFRADAVDWTEPVRFIGGYDAGIDHDEPDAWFPLDRAAGPVLLIDGDDDGMWPATRLHTIAAEHRAAAGRPVTHRTYPGAGHPLGPPGLPTTITQTVMPGSGMTVDVGGTPVATARANRQSWAAVLDHLGLTSSDATAAAP
ncbi:MAG: acyl-CoA thioesterase/bile acid-CoA:amino acid N-acyltransferase family protein [Actinomycetota bacterium]